MLRRMILGGMMALAASFATSTQAHAGVPVSVSLQFGGVVRPAPVVYPAPVAPVAYPVYSAPIAHHAGFTVLYRPCPHDPWLVYGQFHRPWEAERAAETLRIRGYNAYVRHW